jgi:hypothetical protein
MFIGHFALGFAAKRATPRASLAALFGAAQLADIAWPVLLATGLERVRIEPGNTAFTPLDFVSYPYSHSLLLLVVWGLLFGLIYRAATHTDGRAFVVLAALVLSHWVLDCATHRPDVPLYPGGPKLGLGLWNSVPWTLVVEISMFAAGLWIYARATRPQDAVGRWAFLALWVLLFVAYVVSVTSPPPPSVGAIIVVANIGSVLFLLLAWWADRHRVPVTERVS